jgi:hypothetical protein
VRPEGLSQWKNPIDPIGKRTFRGTADVEGSSRHILSFSLLTEGEANNTSFSKTQLVMKFYPDLEILQEELASIVKK